MARLIKPADARLLGLPGRTSREIVSGAQGAVRTSFRRVEVAPEEPGAAPRGPHVHHDFEECIHVLSGAGITETEAGPHRLEAGDTILVPAGELHVTRAVGDQPLTLLCFFPTADVAAGTTEFASWEEARRSR